MTYRATIALLNWNGGDFVEPCVESVLCQTERSIEIIVIDNCSSDDSVDRMEKLLQGSDVEHKVVRMDRNHGICGGLQVALDLANGEYFFPFASDDEMLPHRVQLQCEQLDNDRESSHVGAGAVALIDAHGDPIRRRFGKQAVLHPPRYNGVDPTENVAFSLSVPPAPGLVFRTDALRGIGGYDRTAPVEDVDTFTRLVLLGKSRVITTNEVVSRYRRHGSNASRRTTLMADGLEHTLRTLVDSGVDFGPVRQEWMNFLEARSQGYVSPWGTLLSALATQPLDRPAVRSAGTDVVRSRLSRRRRLKAALAVVVPSLAARRIGRVNG